MARSRPESPAWIRESKRTVARPLDRKPRPGDKRFTVACTVSGLNPVFLIAWWAPNHKLAEKEFRAWLDDDWATISRTFFDEPCVYLFRTGAVTGFVVLPARGEELVDELVSRG